MVYLSVRTTCLCVTAVSVEENDLFSRTYLGVLWPSVWLEKQNKRIILRAATDFLAFPIGCRKMLSCSRPVNACCPCSFFLYLCSYSYHLYRVNVRFNSCSFAFIGPGWIDCCFLLIFFPFQRNNAKVLKAYHLTNQVNFYLFVCKRQFLFCICCSPPVSFAVSHVCWVALDGLCSFKRS